MLKQINLKLFYFAPVFLLLFIAFIGELILPKQEIFILLNIYHSKPLDAFFGFYTNLGDGLISVVAVVILVLLRRRKEAVTLLAAFITSGLTAQVIKRLFDQPRPKVYFEQLKFVYDDFVEDVIVHGGGSFPSGHTTSAFAMATVLALCFKNEKTSIIAFILATLVGYSRIYLAQHFLQDVVAGAFIGVLFGMLSYYVLWQQKLFLKEANARHFSIINFINDK